MKLTKKLFKDGCKFTIIEDREFSYNYEFNYLRKLETVILKDNLCSFTRDYIQESFVCKMYQTYFKIHINFFGISLSKKIFYEDCTVFEN